MDKIELEMAPIDARVIGDVNQLRFLLENLIDEALTVHEDVFFSRIQDVKRACWS